MEGTAIFIFWPTKKKHKNPINAQFKWIDQACVRPGNSTGSSGPLNLVNLRGVCSLFQAYIIRGHIYLTLANDNMCHVDELQMVMDIAMCKE